ncbi:MAG TPA: efflux RND transporter permease subunit [Candidatus Acidoferrales bacterium]|nr:efflux RND transporter permease subunit [Candidatus Acidoferrales bacterium]
MKIIHDAIKFPVTTAVGVLLLVLFGFIGLFRLPVQLTPNVEEPEITVSTYWPGASPHEIEREIVDEQEEQLKSLEGLTKMESSSSDSRGEITLTFQVGADLDSALLKVSNRLEQVPSYPEDADKPVIRSVDVNANAIAWFVLQPAGENSFTGDISTLFDFADDFLKPEFERIPGVAASNIYGGREHEMHVIVDPAKLAARQVTLNQLGAALERENRNYSGGDFDEGKRRYIVRTVGEYSSPEDIENIVIAVRNGVPIYLKDVARAQLGFRKARAQVFQKGQQVLAMNAVKEPGSNVLEVMTELKGTVQRLNRERLQARGLQLVQVYDETDYIRSAIDLVRDNLFVGGSLAIIVLLLFLRSVSSTLVISVAIPISIVGAFLMMYVFGRTLNVISLAGMAFAAGMVVDNSIVVLENIYRHRQMGKPRFTAAHDGAVEVWGAVLASTLTTVAVFIPVVFIAQEVGQLFGDIALAISCSVLLSLLVSITVIPSLSAKILHAAEYDPGRRGFHNLWGGAFLSRRFIRWVTDTVYWITGSTGRRLAVVVVLTVASLGFSYLLMPKTEYLPVGNNNFIFGIMLPPPGLNLEEVASFHTAFDDNLRPLWEAPPEAPESRALPGGGMRTFFFVALNEFAFMGARANDPMRVRELIPEFQRASEKIPGAITVVSQASIFQRGRGEGRNIDIEITGPELERLIELGGEVFGQVIQVLPGSQARPIPSLDLGNPEVQVLTHRRRAAELGIANRDLGFTVSALVDGAKASDYQFQGKEIDLKVKAEESFAHRTHLLEQMPIAAPDGRLVTLGAVAEISVVNGPQTINHRERQRTITIQVTPSEQMPLERAMDLVESDIVGPLRQQGKLGGLYQVSLSGTADKLSEAGRALRWNFLLVLVITYLLMAALFESFLYPFVIMFSVPLGAVGGFLGLAAVNAFLTYQALDVLTMLGFIILVGTVVNNAILIVHQSLNHMREEGLSPRDAIRESVSNRIRPIFMTVGTTVFGMLPLVLFPGAGSELYRGLGSVVVGGLVFSTIFTLFLVPALFSLTLDIRAVLAARIQGWLHPAERPAGDD